MQGAAKSVSGGPLGGPGGGEGRAKLLVEFLSPHWKTEKKVESNLVDSGGLGWDTEIIGCVCLGVFRTLPETSTGLLVLGQVVKPLVVPVNLEFQ